MIMGVSLSAMNIARAEGDRCHIEKLKAFAQHSACISKAYIRDVREIPSVQDTEARVERCKAELITRFERAENRAEKAGLGCPTYGDAVDVHEDVLTACCPLCGCE